MRGQRNGERNIASTSSVFGLPSTIPIPAISQQQQQRRSSTAAQSPPSGFLRRQSSTPSTPPSVDVLMEDTNQLQPQFPQSGGYHNGKVTSRPVNRRSNLLPKSKNFNRVQDQLIQETIPQQYEVISEANVQRLLHSAPASPLLPRTPKAKSRASAGRFPESYVDEDEDDYLFGKMSSESEDDNTSVATSNPIGMSEDMEMTTSDHSNNTEAVQKAMRPPPTKPPTNTWTEFREPLHPAKASASASPSTNVSRLSQGNIFDMDVSTSSPSATTPGHTGKAPKRKLTETDRYEPYAYNISPSLAISVSPSTINTSNGGSNNNNNNNNNTTTCTNFKTKRSNSSHQQNSRSSSPQLSSVVAAASTPGKGSGMGYGTTALGLVASSGAKWGNDNVIGLNTNDNESALETGSSYTSEEAIKSRGEGVDGISRMSLG
ncbi:hypothetical protein E3Q18_02563 [Wallemia mellicola]|nr:hypothetical protein E3Q18_02563 [Wallemia mellicola]